MSDIELIELTLENIEHIGDIMYKIRIIENIKQSQIADDMKKGQSTISGWEQSHKRPTLRMLLLYLNACGWKIAVFKDSGKKKSRLL